MRHNPHLIAVLQDNLRQLRERHNVVGLKTGTEIEDMDAHEIALMNEICVGAGLTLSVKIGGPEARRDMRDCLSIGVDAILAPMVETVYALVNFVDTAKMIMSEAGKKARLAMNLETATTVQNLDSMIATNAFAELNQVTIGRGDLSKSMNLTVDDEEVLTVTRHTLARLNRQHKVTSVGGGLSVQNIGQMAEILPAARFNTRHVVFENCEVFGRNAAQNLTEGLYFEQALYEAMAQMNPAREAFYRGRNRQLEERLPVLRIRRTAVS